MKYPYFYTPPETFKFEVIEVVRSSLLREEVHQINKIPKRAHKIWVMEKFLEKHLSIILNMKAAYIGCWKYLNEKYT
jgi:hypothetical protein